MDKKQLILDFKKKNPNVVIRCKSCGTALSYIHLHASMQWKCPNCHIEFKYNEAIIAKKTSKVGGHKRRVLPDENILDRGMIIDFLSKKCPNGIENYTQALPTLNKNYRMIAFCAALYVTGRRISELIGLKYKKEYLVKPIKRSQISIQMDEDGTKSVLFKRIPVLKTRPKAFKDANGKEVLHYPTCSIKLIYDHDKEILRLLEDYLVKMDKKHGKHDYYVFPFSRTTAYYYVTGVFEKSVYPHWLRHSRFTNMSNEYNFNELMLRQFAGWTTTAMAVKYVHLDEQVLYNTMKSRKNSEI